ncbi:hypothetical protein VA596_41570 [Amycolatopsis sp., V23-08]|uniref:Uncharacterized protein n=1 Tax=Amycolatopsis heterodermiae TaxID=3110235 RepID=A0ABU5RIF2_9PSEU|nr:hypothetical protein [Amycolatopsis sp., V23-08]MEA5366076.1 hypothetical protein [Amycolatopsis sp., V23-08]
MIESLDEKRRDALLVTMPIQPITTGPDKRVHRLGGQGALCGALGALLGSGDWRLVDCPHCRRAGEAGGA